MGDLLSALASWLNPIRATAIGFGGITAFLMGALANPNGLWNQIVNASIDVIVFLLPNHPDNLKLITIVNSVGSLLPSFGTAIIFEMAVFTSSVFLIFLLIKIYKLIPFKLT